VMDDPRVAALEALIGPILADHHMELVELTCGPQGRQPAIRLLVDQVGGVTIQQCAQVHQQISKALEAARLLEGGYTVEVSSPGLDRPLASRRDFTRAIGETVIVVREREDGRPQELRGMVLAVQEEAIVLKLTSGNVTLPLTQIRRAKKALPW